MPSNLFIDGTALLSTSMLQDWLIALDRIIPGTSGELNTLLTDSRIDVETLINSTPNPNIASGTTVVPIAVVSDLKYAIAVYEYQFNPFNAQVYFDMVDNVHSIYDQYSISYYNGGAGKLMIY